MWLSHLYLCVLSVGLADAYCYTYCSYGCCGSYCCSYYDYYYEDWFIAVMVLCSFVGLVTLIGVIACIVSAVKKSQRVVRPVMTVYSTGQTMGLQQQ